MEMHEDVLQSVEPPNDATVIQLCTFYALACLAPVLLLPRCLLHLACGCYNCWWSYWTLNKQSIGVLRFVLSTGWEEGPFVPWLGQYPLATLAWVS